MTACSTKNLWLISLFATSLLHARTDYEAEFRMELNSRLAYHVFEPRDLASHRHTLDVEQRGKWGRWSAVAAAQLLAETAFASNPRYSMEVAQSQSQELTARDVYVQYKDPSWHIRIGNQQVIWGEAFGFYFADIINPKDRRDFGLGELGRQRIPVPMLNAKFILDKSSFQLVYIPKPYFNKEPFQGSDFGNTYRQLFSSVQITTRDERSLPLAWENGEVGLRTTRDLGGIDISGFYFTYHDRAPNYHLNVVSPDPLTLELTGFHPRLDTFGGTATAELNPFVFRLEGIHTVGRGFDFNDNGTYATATSNETTAVVGVDYTGVPAWRFGIQASDSYLSKYIPHALVDRHRPLLTTLVSGPVFRDQNLELILSYVPTDGSSLAQLRYLTPLSSRIELMFGADVLMGGERSSFGRFKSASRGYVLLKGYLMGT